MLTKRHYVWQSVFSTNYGCLSTWLSLLKLHYTRCNSVTTGFCTARSFHHLALSRTRLDLLVPRTRLKFVVAAKAWNDLRLHVRAIRSTDTFKQRLKTYVLQILWLSISERFHVGLVIVSCLVILHFIVGLVSSAVSHLSDIIIIICSVALRVCSLITSRHLTNIAAHISLVLLHWSDVCHVVYMYCTVSSAAVVVVYAVCVAW